MNLPGNAILWALVAVPLIVVVLIARLGPRTPYSLSRSLMVNAFCACCFAGPFLRFGRNKALAAFLTIFGITTLFAVGRWWEQRRRLPSASSVTDRLNP